MSENYKCKVCVYPHVKNKAPSQRNIVIVIPAFIDEGVKEFWWNHDSQTFFLAFEDFRGATYRKVTPDKTTKGRFTFNSNIAVENLKIDRPPWHAVLSPSSLSTPKLIVYQTKLHRPGGGKY